MILFLVFFSKSGSTSTSDYSGRDSISSSSSSSSSSAKISLNSASGQKYTPNNSGREVSFHTARVSISFSYLILSVPYSNCFRVLLSESGVKKEHEEQWAQGYARHPIQYYTR